MEVSEVEGIGVRKEQGNAYECCCFPPRLRAVSEHGHP